MDPALTTQMAGAGRGQDSEQAGGRGGGRGHGQPGQLILPALNLE